MTKNVKIYVAFSLLWSVLFFSVLNWALIDAEHRWKTILVAAVAYGLGFGLMGFVLGKADSARASRANLGLHYYLASNLSSLFVGGLWIALFRPEEWLTLVMMTVVFAVFSVVAWQSSRRSIKGMGKEELFK